jgi:uncharacterized membrane protein
MRWPLLASLHARISPWWLAGGLTLLCAVLVCIAIGRPSYWIDEKVSVDIAFVESPKEVVNAVMQEERRPPAYHLGLWAFGWFFGRTERVARFYSGLWAILLVPAVFQLTRQFGGGRAAILGTLLAATSPILIAYGQTIRYYTMVAALSAFSWVFFFDIKAKVRNAWATYTPYVLVTLVLLFTDYPAWGVLIAQNVIVVLSWKKRNGLFHYPKRGWILVQGGMLSLAALWLPVVLEQGTRDFGAADLSRSFTGLALRVLYPFYAWTVGETLFPWSPLAIGCVILSALVMIFGAVRLWYNEKLVLWLTAFGIPFAVAQLLLATVADDSPFVNAPARSMACFGLLLSLLAMGIASLSKRWIQELAVIFLCVIHAQALANYYTGQSFINTIYNTPAREVAQVLSARAVPGDLIITEDDSMVETYLPPALQAARLSAGKALLELPALVMRPVTVWHVTLGRDRTRYIASASLGTLLRQERELRSSTGFAELDPTYRKVKSLLLGRASYRYRLVVDEYR